MQVGASDPALPKDKKGEPRRRRGTGGADKPMCVVTLRNSRQFLLQLRWSESSSGSNNDRLLLRRLVGGSRVQETVGLRRLRRICPVTRGRRVCFRRRLQFLARSPTAMGPVETAPSLMGLSEGTNKVPQNQI